jgi:hypothetical protein
VFEIKVLRRIFGFERVAVSGESRKLYNKGLYDSY